MSTPPRLSSQASRSKNVDEAATQLGESNKSVSNNVDGAATSTTTQLNESDDKVDRMGFLRTTSSPIMDQSSSSGNQACLPSLGSPLAADKGGGSSSQPTSPKYEYLFPDKSYEEMRWEDSQNGVRGNQVLLPTLGTANVGQLDVTGQSVGSRFTYNNPAADIGGGDNTVNKDKSHEVLTRKYHQNRDKGIGRNNTMFQPGIFLGPPPAQINPFKASSSSSIPKGLPKKLSIGGMFSSWSTPSNQYHKSELDRKVAALEKGVDTTQTVVPLQQQIKALKTELDQYNARFRFVESQILLHKSELNEEVAKLETDLDSQNVGDKSVVEEKELSRRKKDLEIDVEKCESEKELRRRKKDLEIDVEKCEARADGGWNVLLLGISAFGLFYSIMEKQSESKNRYDLYACLAVLAFLGILPLVISTICKMHDIDTKLKTINASHEELKSVMGTNMPSEVSTSDSTSDELFSLRIASEPEKQPLLSSPQNSQLLRHQHPRSTSFHDMMQQPLPLRNFWWRYVLPTYTIGSFAILFALYVACRFG